MPYDSETYIPLETVEIPEHKKLLSDALALLIEKGWTQGRFCRRGAHCIVGALMESNGGHGYIESTPRGLGAIVAINMAINPSLDPNEWIGSKSPYELGPIMAWNDDRLRTFDEVEAIFKKALEE